MFEGKVIEIGRKEEGEIEVLFEVKKIWKGTNFTQIIVYTDGGDCVFHFVEGRVLSIFFSKRTGKQLYIHSCSGTKRLDEAEIERNTLSHIAKGVAPTKKVDLKGEMVSGFSWWQVAIISICLLLIIVLL